MVQQAKIGLRFTNRHGDECEIIEYINCNNVTIKFISDNVVLYNKQFGHVKRGYFENPMKPTLCGKGFIGIGKFNSKNNPYYLIWRSMIERCYSERKQKISPSYIGCSVVDDWFNFQNFANWATVNYKEQWVLDKDILIKRNKIYGPNTCCFVPVFINSLFTKSNRQRGKYPIGVSFNKQQNKFTSTVKKNNESIFLGYHNTIEEAFGIYKNTKEKIIKTAAESVKHIINKSVYDSMLLYTVDLND